MRKILLECKEQERLVGIHTDPEEISRFALGWLIDVGKTEYVLHCIDEYGKPDGIHLGYIEDVVRISLDGAYISRVESFAKANLAKSLREFASLEADISQALVDFSKSKDLITILDKYRVPASGYVENYEDRFVTLKEISTQGLALGRIVFPLAAILRIEAFGNSEKSIDTLHRWLTEYQATEPR